MVIDWPHREVDQFAPRDGFAFAIYDTEQSVHDLINASRSSLNGYMLNIKTNGFEKAVCFVFLSLLSLVYRFKFDPGNARTNTGRRSQLFQQIMNDSAFLLVVCQELSLRVCPFSLCFINPSFLEELGRTLTKKLGDVMKVEIETDKGTNYPKVRLVS